MKHLYTLLIAVLIGFACPLVWQIVQVFHSYIALTFGFCTADVLTIFLFAYPLLLLVHSTITVIWGQYYES